LLNFNKLFKYIKKNNNENYMKNKLDNKFKNEFCFRSWIQKKIYVQVYL
jgi:hypothetical protein